MKESQVDNNRCNEFWGRTQSDSDWRCELPAGHDGLHRTGFDDKSQPALVWSS